MQLGHAAAVSFKHTLCLNLPIKSLRRSAVIHPTEEPHGFGNGSILQENNHLALVSSKKAGGSKPCSDYKMVDPWKWRLRSSPDPRERRAALTRQLPSACTQRLHPAPDPVCSQPQAFVTFFRVRTSCCHCLFLQLPLQPLNNSLLGTQFLTFR